jgi:hypothetical protein
VATLSGMAQAVRDLLKWAPTMSTTATNELYRAIQRAVDELYDEAPHLFETEGFRFFTEADIDAATITGSTDTLEVASGDAWVLKRSTAIGSLAAADLWPTDTSMAGRILEITDSNSIVHRREIRSVWSVLEPAHQYISLVEPWINASDTGLTYKIKRLDYALPARIQKIRAIYGFNVSERPAYFEPGTQGTEYVAADSVADSFHPFSGRRRAYSVGYRGLPTPTYKPPVQPKGDVVDAGGNTTTKNAGTWVGPVPPGTFQFRYTQVFGHWNDNVGLPGPVQGDFPASSSVENAVYRRLEPRLESSPSPESASVTVDSTELRAILIGLPDPNWELGFGDQDRVRYQRAGIRTRIYVKRVSTASYDASHPPAASGSSGDVSSDRPSGYNLVQGQHVNVQAREDWYLLDEVEGHIGQYTWTGRVLPDTSRRLPAEHQHLTLQFYPRLPGDRYMDVQGFVKPSVLVEPNDAIHVPETAVRYIVAKAAVFFCPDEQAAALARAETELLRTGRQLRKTTGSAIPEGQAVRRRAPVFGRRR